MQNSCMFETWSGSLSNNGNVFVVCDLFEFNHFQNADGLLTHFANFYKQQQKKYEQKMQMSMWSSILSLQTDVWTESNQRQQQEKA